MSNIAFLRPSDRRIVYMNALAEHSQLINKVTILADEIQVLMDKSAALTVKAILSADKLTGSGDNGEEIRILNNQRDVLMARRNRLLDKANAILKWHVETFPE